MTKIQKTYYFIVLLSLFVCWSPLKPLAYILPIIAISIILIVCLNEKIISIKALSVLLIILIITSITIILNKDFAFQNVFIALLTYSSFYIFIIIPSGLLKNKILTSKIIKISLIFLFVETVLGLIQLMSGYLRYGNFDTATGDRVEGTIHLPLPSSESFSNVMFALNILFILVFLFPYYNTFSKKNKRIFIGGIIILILASVMHVTLFFIVCLLFTSIILWPSSKQLSMGHRIIMIIALILPLFVMVLIMPSNMRIIPVVTSRIVSGEIPKAKLMYELITDIPENYPQINFLGLGPGQFDSKAALIGSEMYFGSPTNPRDLPLISGVEPPAFKEYVYPKWYPIADLGLGSTYWPFSSWIAVYGEFGRITFILLFISFLFFIAKIRYLSIKYSKRKIGFAIISGFSVLFLLGFQELYWENPQSIFPGLLYLKLLLSELS